MKLKNIVVVAGLSLGLAQAHAALTRFGSSDDFNSALKAGTGQMETFEGLDSNGDARFETGTPVSGAGVRLFGDNSFTGGLATLSGGGNITQDETGGRQPHSQDLFLDGGTDPFTILFDTAVKAFGFWGSDIGDFGASGDCDANDPNCTGNPAAVLRILVNLTEAVALGMDDSVSDCTLVNAVGGKSSQLACEISGGKTDGNFLFWGLASSSEAAIQSIVFTNLTTTATSGLRDGQGFDDFVIGDIEVDGGGGGQTPEPGVLALAGLGLLAAGAARRRRVRR